MSRFDELREKQLIQVKTKEGESKIEEMPSAFHMNYVRNILEMDEVPNRLEVAEKKYLEARLEIQKKLEFDVNELDLNNESPQSYYRRVACGYRLIRYHLFLQQLTNEDTYTKGNLMDRDVPLLYDMIPEELSPSELEEWARMPIPFFDKEANKTPLTGFNLELEHVAKDTGGEIPLIPTDESHQLFYLALARKLALDQFGSKQDPKFGVVGVASLTEPGFVSAWPNFENFLAFEHMLLASQSSKMVERGSPLFSERYLAKQYGFSPEESSQVVRQAAVGFKSRFQFMAEEETLRFFITAAGFKTSQLGQDTNALNNKNAALSNIAKLYGLEGKDEKSDLNIYLDASLPPVPELPVPPPISLEEEPAFLKEIEATKPKQIPSQSIPVETEPEDTKGRVQF